MTCSLYQTVAELPPDWDLLAQGNIFLRQDYLQALENSAPVNMKCLYIGVWEAGSLVGILLSQYIDTHKLESFGERDRCLKTFFRNMAFRNFASHTLFLGNNMVTGQNGYAFASGTNLEKISKYLLQSAHEVTHYYQSQGIKIHLVTFKDFYQAETKVFEKEAFRGIYGFSVQPNMILYLDKGWLVKADYVAAFSKKYRDQYKRARKKFEGITVKDLSLEEIKAHEGKINTLYHYVARNAPFNTFFLAANHFSAMKEKLAGFSLFGYFKQDKLVGFHTVIANGSVLETYFLGYDQEQQKTHMLYLNMLYNMTEFGIEKGFGKIIFGRTALEIKSSVGAVPIEMYGFMYHSNPLINHYLRPLFNRLQPRPEWQLRHPFK